MTKAQVEVITSVQRRRRWSSAEKERIVAAAIEPGAVASEVARAAGIHTSQLFRWRQQLCGPAQAAPVFSPVAVAPGPGAVSIPALPTTQGAIEIEFATGARMRITGPVDPSTVRALITALAKAKRRRR
jgi:transposase